MHRTYQRRSANNLPPVRRLGVLILLASMACTSAGNDVTTRPETATTATTATTVPAGWVELAPMAVARSEHPAVVLDGAIVVAGGYLEVGVGRIGVTPTVETYQPGTDSWSGLPDLPEARHHGMAAAAGGRLFFIGGYTPAGDASAGVWELADGVWVDRATLPSPVAAGAAVATEDAILLVGGVPTGSFYRYDIAGDAWTPLTSPATPREHLAATVLDGEVWAIGGRWEGGIFDTTEVYDPAAGSWRAGPQMVEARSGFGAAVVDGSIVVAGGEVFGPDEALASVERLVEAGAGWVTIEPLPHGLHGSPLVAIASAVYLPGGSTRPAAVANDPVTYRLEIG
jgi:N-acetylneuraminic acid mutarotase